MSSEENKSIVFRLFNEFYRGSLDIADELFADSVTLHDAGKTASVSPEILKQRQHAQMEATPDFSMELHEVIADIDSVAYRWTMRGTHLGPMRGIPATGKKFEMTGITIMRIQNGKIIEGWHQYDALGMMQQLGVIPAR